MRGAGLSRAYHAVLGFISLIHTMGTASALLTGNGGGFMKNNDELKGKMEQVKGRVKQATGDLTDNERLHDEGVADEAVGNAREGVGKARRKVGEAIEDIGEQLKD